MSLRKTKEEQQEFQERRAEEIFSTMREVKQLARKKSMQVAHSVEERWRESEQKAKAFERTRKASFNQARKLSQRVCRSFLMGNTFPLYIVSLLVLCDSLKFFIISCAPVD